MHREIKFMAYIKSLKWTVPVTAINFSSETVEVDLTYGNGDTSEYDFGEVELLQFTGVHDIKEEELYEDNLLQSQVGDRHIWRIVFEDGSFVLEQINGYKKRGQKKHTQDFCCEDDISLYKLVKIGNIYENPELLEGYICS